MPWSEQATVILVTTLSIVVIRLLNYYYPKDRHAKNIDERSVPHDPDDEVFTNPLKEITDD